MQSLPGFAPPSTWNTSDGNYNGLMGIISVALAFVTQSSASGGLHIVVYGLLLEFTRRALQYLYSRLLVQPRVSATFTQGDPAYEWIMLFLTTEGVWKRSKDFDVSTKSTQRKFTFSPTAEELGVESKVDLVPTWRVPHLFRWKGYWIDVSRGKGGEGVVMNEFGPQTPATLKFHFFTLDPVVIARFVEEARKRYEEANKPRVTVHLSDSSGGMFPGMVWNNTKSKARRPIESVALPPGVMNSILEDLREFISIEGWYRRAGIPHHRGYLLYGPPGTGKTSTIYALAGELGLEIYALSLADSHIDDGYLQRIASAVPRGSILLIEDIDCAFPSRDAEDEDEFVPLPMPPGMVMPSRIPMARVTMSGILNLMDGVASDDGRIIFATTNYYDRLDPALVRPGRMDVKIEYKRATADQAAALFDRFFPLDRFSTSESPSTPSAPSLANIHPRSSLLTRSLTELRDTFAASLPEHEFTTAELQGYLLTCKWDPACAVDGFGPWMEMVRTERVERVVREEKEKEKRRKAKKAAFANAAAMTPGATVAPVVARGRSPPPSPPMGSILFPAAPRLTSHLS